MGAQFRADMKKGNMTGLTKRGRRPVGAKKTMSTKKALYAIYYSHVRV